MEFEEEDDKEGGNADDREIDPEYPAPADVLSEAATLSTS